MLCDVNSFKQINDTFGHAAGDGCAGDRTAFNDAVRRPDTAFRWAGDEFAVILRATESRRQPRAARLRESGRRLSAPGRGLTIGTGVAELKSGMSAEEVLVEADRALFSYKAQRSRLAGAA